MLHVARSRTSLQRALAATLGVVGLDLFAIGALRVLAARLAGDGLVVWMVRSTNVPFLVCWALAAFGIVRRHRIALPWIAPATSDRRTLLFVIAGVLLLAFLYFDAAERLFAGRWASPHAARLVETAVAVPLVEEVLFRGILWEECRRLTAKPSPLIVIALTTLAFAAWHVPLAGSANLVGHALFGLAVACLRQGLRSLLPCVACHAVGNLLAAVVYETS